MTRNDVEFRLYHKYSAETKILADTPDETPAPLPESQTKEQQPGVPSGQTEKPLKPNQ